ncbi:hypothetical protein ACHAXH_001295 [Discostella pseudostelligera]
MLAYDDNDTQVIAGMLGTDFTSIEGRECNPHTCGVFYKATVIAVSRFGSETWNLAPSSLKRLKGFHIRATWHMAGTGPRRNPNESWTYPDTDAVTESVGVCSISHYVEVCQQHISNYIVNQPIFNACRDGVRRLGSPVIASFGGTSLCH